MLARFKDFDEITDSINTKFNEWVEEAKRINRRFKLSWTQTAEKLIKKDFAQRWLKEVATKFKYKGNIAWTVLTTIFEKEELLRMNMSQFTEAVKKSKQFYKRIIDNVEGFVKNATIQQDISEGILFASRDDVLWWEHYFNKIGYRPNVFYYDEINIREAIIKNWQQCKSNTHNAKPPQPREVQIFEAESNKSLHTL